MATKQEEIREGIDDFFLTNLLAVWHSGNLTKSEEAPINMLKELVKAFKEYLHSQGVVLKVDREPFRPDCVGMNEKDTEYFNFIWDNAQWRMKEAGYVAVEPLIQDSVDHSLDPLWKKVIGNAVKDGQLSEDEGEHFIEKYDAGLNPGSTEPTFKESDEIKETRWF